MSASSRESSLPIDAMPMTGLPITRWPESDAAVRGDSRPRRRERHSDDRLPWQVAVPLIATMSIMCWVAVWKGCAALVSLLP